MFTCITCQIACNSVQWSFLFTGKGAMAEVPTITSIVLERLEKSGLWLVSKEAFLQDFYSLRFFPSLWLMAIVPDAQMRYFAEDSFVNNIQLWLWQDRYQKTVPLTEELIAVMRIKEHDEFLISITWSFQQMILLKEVWLNFWELFTVIPCTSKDFKHC